MGPYDTENVLRRNGHHHSDKVAGYRLERIFTNYTYNRRMIPKIYKEFKQISSKQKHNYIYIYNNIRYKHRILRRGTQMSEKQRIIRHF
jgi:hypothetical protein